MSFDVEAVRAQFPILDQEVHGKPLVYLDSAASAQQPRAVLDAVRAYCERDHANVHRAVHTLSQRATAAFEDARGAVARHLGAATPREIVFTRGTTEALNLVAWSWGMAHLGAGDRILLTRMEHHANIVPWQLVAERTGAVIDVAEIDDRGVLDLDDFERKLTDRTRVVGVVHVSNALGTVNPVADIAARAHDAGAVVVVDGAQAAPHARVDVHALGADFYALSGHKVYAPTGIGALWAREALLHDMPPWQGGGEMIRSVRFEHTEFAPPPTRFEAGTPNIAGAVGLGAALRWLDDLDLDAVAAHEAALLAHGAEVLADIPHLRLVGTAPDRAGVLSFVFDNGIHPHDVGTILDMEGVAVRTGHHCAQPVMARYGIPATTRASVGVYTTRDDLDRLGAALRRVLDLLG